MEDSKHSPGAPRVVLGAAILGVVLAAGLGVLRLVNSEPPVRAAEWLGNLALAGVFATPALLALLGLRGRPVLTLAGGALGILLAALGGFPGVALILLVPGVLYLVGAARAGGPWPGTSRTAAVVFLSLAVGWGALLLLHSRADPICWALVPGEDGPTYVRVPAEPFVHRQSISMSSEDLPPGATASGCSSDSISPVEALSTIVLVIVMLGVVWILGSARSATRGPGPERAEGTG